MARVMRPFAVGDVQVASVMEFVTPWFDPGVLFPDSTPEAAARHRDRLGPHCIDAASGALIMASQSFLLRTPHHTVLIDTCVGNHKQRPNPKLHGADWPWLDRLGTAGVAPQDIDMVLCTHLHVDHVGWNTCLKDGRWVPTFPNARYLFHRREFEARIEADRNAPNPAGDYMGDSVAPVMDAGQGVLVDGDHEIGDGLWLEPAPGHSPGHVCIRLERGGLRALFSGDVMHHPIQCAEPSWSSRFCTDPAESRRTRRSLLERCADTDVVVVPAHFPNGTAGRVVSAGDGFRFAFLPADELQ